MSFKKLEKAEGSGCWPKSSTGGGEEVRSQGTEAEALDRTKVSIDSDQSWGGCGLCARGHGGFVG